MKMYVCFLSTGSSPEKKQKPKKVKPKNHLLSYPKINLISLHYHESRPRSERHAIKQALNPCITRAGGCAHRRCPPHRWQTQVTCHLVLPPAVYILPRNCCVHASSEQHCREGGDARKLGFVFKDLIKVPNTELNVIINHVGSIGNNC